MDPTWQLEGPHHAVLASLSSQFSSCPVDEELEVGYDGEDKKVFDAHAFAREDGRTDAHRAAALVTSDPSKNSMSTIIVRYASAL